MADNSQKEMEAIKEEVKKLNLKNKTVKKMSDENFKKEVVVRVFKDVIKNNITSES